MNLTWGNKLIGFLPHHLDIITCTLIVLPINISIYDSIQTMIHFCNQPIFSAEIMGFEEILKTESELSKS